MIDELTRPLRGHLSIPGKVVTDWQAVLYFHISLEDVVQEIHESLPQRHTFPKSEIPNPKSQFSLPTIRKL